MKLNILMRRFATEAEARRWFERSRRPDGSVCPKCGVLHRSSRLATRPVQFTCLDCRHRYSVTSVTSGSALHNTKLPLRVTHSNDEFARTCEETNLRVHVNTTEFSNAMLKRGIVGAFHSATVC